jgi:hypothetical protein
MMDKLLGQKWLTLKTKAMILLGVVCLILRAPLLLAYEPNAYPDTLTYLAVAKYIQRFNFEGYLGDRPPGYPVFLLLGGMNYHIIWWMQSILGICISLLLFSIAYSYTKNRWLSFVVGLSYSICINLLLFEANILAETLTTFLLILSLWLLIRILDRPSESSATRYYLGIGIVVGVVSLTRAQMLFLIPAYFLFFLYYHWRTKTTFSVGLKNFSLYTIPVLVMVFGWILFNQFTVGYFGITSIMGFGLTNFSGSIIEQAPDEYAPLRDIYLKYRAQQIEKTGSYVATIARALPEMQATTGLSYSEISKEMARMSIDVLAANPGVYFKTVSQAWESFWLPAMTWMDLGNLHSPELRLAIRYIRIAEQWLLEHLNTFFLVLSVWYFILVMRGLLRPGFHFFVIAIILLASVSQALVEYGENSRYALPFQPLILYIIILWIYEMTKSLTGVIHEKTYETLAIEK